MAREMQSPTNKEHKIIQSKIKFRWVTNQRRSSIALSTINKSLFHYAHIFEFRKQKNKNISPPEPKDGEKKLNFI